MPSRKNELPKRLDRMLGLLSRMYGQEGERALQELLVNAKVRIVEETSYDNWDGGQYGHDVYLTIPEGLYVLFLKTRGEVATRLKEGLNQLNDIGNEFVSDVFLELLEGAQSEWRQESGLLLGPEKAIAPGAEARIWKQDQYRVFLSHKSEVKVEVGELKKELAIYGMSGFVAHEDIHPTQEWMGEIEAALETADAFVAVLTDKFHESLWTDQEVGYALARGIPIIALRLGRDPYGFIGKFQALACNWNTAAVGAAKLLMRHDRMLAAYIEAISRARSFAEANFLGAILSSIEEISVESAAALVAAYNDNSEARGGFALNGLKPGTYGLGLVAHLARLGHAQYRYVGERRVEAG